MPIAQSGPRRRSRFGFMLLLLVPLAPCACSSGDPRLYPVHGQVFYEGKPADGAVVFFHPVADAPPQADSADAHPSPAELPYGKVGPDGSFELTTSKRGKGAPAGRYNVTVVWTRSTGASDSDEESLLPLRYMDPTASALAVEIKESDNKLVPFQLGR